MRFNPFLLLLLPFPFTHGANTFRRPPGPGRSGDYRDNPVYTIGQQVDFQWDMDHDNIDLILTQSSPERDPSVNLLENTNVVSHLWTVNLDGLAFPAWYDPKLSPVYFLRMVEAGTTGGGTTSHYFNITEAAVSPTSTSATGTSTPSTNTATTSPTSDPGGDGNKGLSGGAIAGIAIGATLGTIAVVGVVGWMVWRRLQRRKQVGAGADVQDKNSYAKPHEIHGDSHVRYEIGTSDQAYEMPDGYSGR